jgi:hypothetical protein
MMNDDIKAMFAEAAEAAEDTGETIPGKSSAKQELKEVKNDEVQNKEVIKKPVITQEKTMQGLNVELVEKIIKMKEILDSYENKELEFVKGYFNHDGKEIGASEVIFSALTIDKRGLDALSKIVIARNHDAAERAFYLMELDNYSIEAIHEQVNLIVGELDSISSVNSSNKIQVCRLIENAISSMPSDAFKLINKLQDFTNIAIG